MMIRNQNLAADLLLSCVQLAAACQSVHSPMVTPALPRLLQAALPELAECAPLAEPLDTAWLAQLPGIAANVRQISTQAEQRSELATTALALRELLTLRGLVAAPGCREIRLVLRQPRLFRLLNTVRLSPVDSRPLLMLAGDAGSNADVVPVASGGQNVLEQLEMAYRPGELFPCWRSNYFVRVPPNPARQRFSGWTPPQINRAGSIEFYRSLFPAELPFFRVKNEAASLPLTITSPELELVVDIAGAGLGALRSTVTNLYREPQLIIEHVIYC